jgi:hypothetical protein
MRAVSRVRERFPQLQLVVRARSRTEAYEYTAMGVWSIREVFGSALEATRKMLTLLGYADPKGIVRRFEEHDERQILESAPHRHDEARLIALSEQGRRDIAQLLAQEAKR